MSERRWFDEWRQWLAGKVFLLAGVIHESYAVYLDGAPSRKDTPASWDEVTP